MWIKPDKKHWQRKENMQKAEKKAKGEDDNLVCVGRIAQKVCEDGGWRKQCKKSEEQQLEIDILGRKRKHA